MLDGERDDDGAEPFGELARELRLRGPVAVEQRVGDPDPAAGEARTSTCSSRGRNCASVRSTERRSSLCTWVEAREGLSGGLASRASSSSSGWARMRETGEKPSRAQTSRAAPFASSTSSINCVAPAARAAAATSARSAFATPLRRPRGRT